MRKLLFLSYVQRFVQGLLHNASPAPLCFVFFAPVRSDVQQIPAAKPDFHVVLKQNIGGAAPYSPHLLSDSISFFSLKATSVACSEVGWIKPVFK